MYTVSPLVSVVRAPKRRASPDKKYTASHADAAKQRLRDVEEILDIVKRRVVHRKNGAVTLHPDISKGTVMTLQKFEQLSVILYWNGYLSDMLKRSFSSRAGPLSARGIEYTRTVLSTQRSFSSREGPLSDKGQKWEDLFGYSMWVELIGHLPMDDEIYHNARMLGYKWSDLYGELCFHRKVRNTVVHDDKFLDDNDLCILSTRVLWISMLLGYGMPKEAVRLRNLLGELVHAKSKPGLANAPPSGPKKSQGLQEIPRIFGVPTKTLSVLSGSHKCSDESTSLAGQDMVKTRDAKSDAMGTNKLDARRKLLKCFEQVRGARDMG
ncbi:hypothetical protein YB2330_004996 [Saitoella coloradoensis]